MTADTDRAGFTSCSSSDDPTASLPPPVEELSKASARPLPRVLFLDDDPGRAADFLAEHPHAVWVETAQACIERLDEPWDEVHLDHDLGGEIFVDSSRADCGMEVVRWLCDEGRRSHLCETIFTVHTHNMNAASEMMKSLRGAGYLSVYRPFGIDVLKWLQEVRKKHATPDPGDSLGTWKQRWLGPLRRFAARITGWPTKGIEPASLATDTDPELP